MVSSLVVVVLALVGGCSPAEDPPVVVAPGHSHGFIVLRQDASDSGLYYDVARDVELRLNGDLATLQVERDRYVDCVSNPAAAVWEDPLRGGTPTR